MLEDVEPLELTETAPEDDNDPDAPDAAESRPAVEDDIVIEGEDEEEPGDPLIKKIRSAASDALKRASDAEKRAAALEARLAGDAEPTEPGPFPEYDDPAYEYDVDRLKAAQILWHKKDAAYRASKEHADREQREQQRKVQDLEISYRTSAMKLAPVNAAVFEEADRTVRTALGDDAPIAMAAFFKEPAKLVVALHKYPSRRQAIMDEPDNTKKLLLLKELEMAIKSGASRVKPPAPESETIQRGSAPLSVGNPDKKLKQLEAEADRTGDRTKIQAYKRSLKEKVK